MSVTERGELQWVAVERCIALRRNPQYVSPHDMEALKASIARDGFLAPVLLRRLAGTDDYEVVSGNHRVMAARELGLVEVPAIVTEMDDATVKRAAINMNTVHGDPTAEMLVPFLAELDAETLRTVHLGADLLAEVVELDKSLAAGLKVLEIPIGSVEFGPTAEESQPRLDQPSPIRCPGCGHEFVPHR